MRKHVIEVWVSSKTFEREGLKAYMNPNLMSTFAGGDIFGDVKEPQTYSAATLQP